MSIGPQLPPHLRHLLGGPSEEEDESKKKDTRETDDEDEEVIGPTLPPGFPNPTKKSEAESEKKSSSISSDSGSKNIGPSLPPGFKLPANSISDEEDSDEDDVIGPPLPPNLRKSINKERKDEKRESDQMTDTKRIGPTLPPGFRPPSDASVDDNEEEESDDEVVGPTLPCSNDQEDEEAAEEEYRRRLEALRQSQGPSDQPTKREEWMTKIPKKTGRKLGFENVKSFSQRSSKKDDEKPVKPLTKDQLEEQEKLKESIEQYNSKKRSATLIDMHQDKLKKKAKEEESKPQERQMFDPEKDLAINGLDARQKKSVLDKAKLLNKRFSHGSSTFL